MKKSVLITGCSDGGIGSALARVFQRHDFHVFATARTISKMSELDGMPNIQCVKLDVTSPSDITSAVDAVRKATGGTLDVLVNNSGSQCVIPALEMDRITARSLFDVNFWGVFDMIQAFQSLMMAAKGTVVNVSSISGYLNTPFMSVYNASKAAVTMFGETLRLEMLPLGVRVLNVITGAVDTRIMSNSPTPQLRPDLPYAQARDKIVRMASGNDGIKRTSRKDFAEQVVQDVLQGATGRVWRGSSATLTRFATVLIPTATMDRILSGSSGLQDLL